MSGIEVRIQIEGLSSLRSKLSPAMFAATLAAPMKRAQELIRTRMAHYPPPPPNSSYIRTGDLGASWASQSPIESMGGLMGTVESTEVVYAGWVERDPLVGSPSQASIHRGRWQTDLQVIQGASEEIRQDFTAAIQEAFNR